MTLDASTKKKSGRKSHEKGLAAKVLVKGEDGYQAATYAGREAYCKHFGGNTIQESKEIRQRQRAERTEVSLCSMSTPLPESGRQLPAPRITELGIVERNIVLPAIPLRD